MYRKVLKMIGAFLYVFQKFESEEDVTWRELMSDRVFRSADSALIALTIMTSVGMPKQVYVEDAIERAVLLVKFQLQNVIFPAYDPVYRTDKDKKRIDP